jgi:hypothetical protein
MRVTDSDGGRVFRPNWAHECVSEWRVSDKIVRSVTSLFPVKEARDLHGRTLSSLCVDPMVDPVQLSLDATGSNCDIGGPVEVLMRGGERGRMTCVVHVIDQRDGLFVVALQEVYSSKGLGAFEPAQQPAALPSEIGFYSKIPKPLGAGHTGEVMRGVHRPTAMPIAVKTLRREVFEEIGLSWPGREVSLMQHLNHPNIVQVTSVLCACHVLWGVRVCV